MRAWAPVTATAAPLVLIGGWVVAGPRQPAGYSAVHDSVSALAKHGAHDPGLMITALVVGGLLHVASAVALPELGRPAQFFLALGGLALVVVGLARQPSPIHPPVAAIGFAAFVLWPALARVERRVGVATSIGLTVLLGWFVVSIATGSGLGLSERVLSGVQGLCPLLFVVLIARAERGRRPARSESRSREVEA